MLKCGNFCQWSVNFFFFFNKTVLDPRARICIYRIQRKKNCSHYKLQHPQAAEDSKTGTGNLLQKTTSPSKPSQGVTQTYLGLYFFCRLPKPAKHQQLFTLIPTSVRNQICLGGWGSSGILRQAVQILYNIYIYIYYTGTETMQDLTSGEILKY